MEPVASYVMSPSHWWVQEQASAAWLTPSRISHPYFEYKPAYHNILCLLLWNFAAAGSCKWPGIIKATWLWRSSMPMLLSIQHYK